MGRNTTLLDLLFELQTLDRVPRSGYALRGVAAPESVAEHSFHLAFLVWALARNEPRVDALKALELALVHDLAEVRTGDLPRTVAHYFPSGAKRATESAIAEDLLAPLGGRGPALFREYQAKETTEARFVGICDKLQLLIKARVYERRGSRGLEEFWDHLEDLSDEGFGSIREVLEELRRERGQGTAE